MNRRSGGPPSGDRSGPEDSEQLRGGVVAQQHQAGPGQVPPDTPPAGQLLGGAAREATAVAAGGAFLCRGVPWCGVFFCWFWVLSVSLSLSRSPSLSLHVFSAKRKALKSRRRKLDYRKRRRGEEAQFGQLSSTNTL